MNHIHGTHRLSVALAGLAAAAALALPAFQGTATAASHRPQHHHAAQAIVQQTQNGRTVAGLSAGLRGGAGLAGPNGSGPCGGSHCPTR